MPLVLAVRKGQQFSIGGETYTCSEVGHERPAPEAAGAGPRFYCTGTITSADGKSIAITSDWVHVSEDVWIRTGFRHQKKGRLLSLQINAAGKTVRRITLEEGTMK